jgi:hypothetical protein
MGGRVKDFFGELIRADDSKVSSVAVGFWVIAALCLVSLLVTGQISDNLRDMFITIALAHGGVSFSSTALPNIITAIRSGDISGAVDGIEKSIKTDTNNK